MLGSDNTNLNINRLDESVDRYSSYIQRLLILAIVLTIPTTFRLVMSNGGFEETPIYPEFNQVVVFLPHIYVLSLFVVLLLQFSLSENFQICIKHLLGNFMCQGGIWWAILLGWIGCGIFWAGNPELTIYQFADLALALSLTVMVMFLYSHGYDIQILLMLTAASCFHGIIAFLQVLMGKPLGLTILGESVWDQDHLFAFSEKVFRGYALSVHPNNLAGYLVIGIFGCTVLLYKFRKLKRNLLTWIAGLGLFLSLLGLISTFSKVAIASLIIGFGFCLILYKCRKPSAKISVITLSAILVIVALVLFIPELREGVVTRFGDLYRSRYLLRRLTYEFPNTLKVAYTAPLVGVGSGNLMVTISKLQAGLNNVYLPAHNVYLVVWAETGLVGIFLFITACSQTTKGLRMQPTELLILSCCTLTIYLIMIFDYYFWMDLRSRIALFLCLGLWWGQKQSMPLPTGSSDKLVAR